MTIQRIKFDRLVSDDDLKTLAGQYLGDEWIHHEIDYDCDIYDSETNAFICSFRKKRVSSDLTNLALDTLAPLAVASRGRGHAAGPIDPESKYWRKRTLVNTKGTRTGYLKSDGTPSKMSVNNQVGSIALGFFDKTKALGVDLPCRLTYHTAAALNQYETGLSYIDELNRWYKKIHPDKHKIQLERANTHSKYKIRKTAYSTITVNRTFRTALHKDKGDFGGIATLSVLEHGRYRGGLFMMPAYGIGINMREGDVLVADVHQFHCNSEIWTTEEDDQYNDSLPERFKIDKNVGTLGLDKKYSRISFVCYLRSNLVDCV